LSGLLSNYGFSLSLSILHATKTAWQFISAVTLAAVGDIFGILSVEVSDINTFSRSIFKHSAATWHIFVYTPWPISVAPVVIKTVPSVYIFTNAPAWFKNAALNDIPNLTGTIDIPLFFYI